MPTVALDSRPPALPQLLGEARAMAAWPLRAMRRTVMPAEVDGPPVLVLPGFLSSDRSTAVLRRALAHGGYRPHGWNMGVNWGTRADTLDRIAARLGRVHAMHDAPVTLMGWSLGGIYAREVAKLAPDLVSRVVTLGTPFSGSLRANHAWKLYELINRHKVDVPPIDVVLGEKPPVPTYAFWSRRDGIVAAASACGHAHESDEQFELDCTHVGFATDLSAISHVVALLRR